MSEVWLSSVEDSIEILYVAIRPRSEYHSENIADDDDDDDSSDDDDDDDHDHHHHHPYYLFR